MYEELEHNGMPEWEPGSDADLNVSSILFVGAIGIVLTIVIVMLLTALYHQTLSDEQRRKSVSAGDLQVSDTKSSQLEQLNGYRWVDTKGGVVALPIDRAMDLVISENAGQGEIDLASVRDLQPEHLVPGDMVLLARKIGRFFPAQAKKPAATEKPAADNQPPAQPSGAQH